MLYLVSSRTSAPRPKKVSKRRYLNLKSNENLSGRRETFEALRPDVLDCSDFFHYPVYDEAYAALRRHLGVSQVLLTAGCNDAIRIIAASLDKERNRVLLSLPNYDGYRRYFDLNEIAVVPKYREPSRPHDLSQLTALAVEQKCNIIVLTNPDPCVGDCFDRAAIADFVGRCGTLGITVILDEVYAGFGRESDVGLTSEHANLVVLNSLSKSYGMPGVRVGWIAGAGDLIDVLGCEFPESSISGFSLSLLVRLLDDSGWIAASRAAVVHNRAALATALSSVNSIALYKESATNFLLFRALDYLGGGGLWEAMLGRGVYVADLSAIPGFTDHYRVTACASADREKLLDGLEYVRRSQDPGRGAPLQRQDDPGQNLVRQYRCPAP